MQKVWEEIGVSRTEWKKSPWHIQRMVLKSLGYVPMKTDIRENLFDIWIKENADYFNQQKTIRQAKGNLHSQAIVAAISIELMRSW